MTTQAMSAEQNNTRAGIQSDQRNTDLDTSSKCGDSTINGHHHTESKSANRHTFIKVDGVQHTQEFLNKCVAILSNNNACLDASCMLIQMMHLQKNMKEQENDSLGIIFVTP